MKKLLLLISLLGCAALAKAQSSTYHAFKVDLTFGYAIPPSNGDASTNIKAGATITVEPHYRITDALAVGFRFEGAGLGYADTNSGDNSSANISIIYSYCPSLEYYLMKGGFRPFIGAGAGIFDQGSITVNNNTGGSTEYASIGSKFGFFPRGGFEAGHFRISAEYNILGNNSNYAAFALGFFFGGGRK